MTPLLDLIAGYCTLASASLVLAELPLRSLDCPAGTNVFAVRLCVSHIIPRSARKDSSHPQNQASGKTMARIEFPNSLKGLLEEGELQAPIRAFADRVGEILADNKLPFFPDYTDHGIEHIECVLRSEVELVPKDVWERSRQDSSPRLLCDADAAVIIGATLLHDIAMHLRPPGFLELTAPESRFRPLPWFKEPQEGHPGDRSWHELWDDYVREARRMSDRKLGDIIGLESVRRGWKFHSLPEDPGQWDLNRRLVVGEFIRRHHARLAHEIAIYGFPGLPAGAGEGQFPALGSENGHPLGRLADLIGLAARSHGISLRLCKSYLDASPRYAKNPRPMGTAVLYPMALLRVADYLQIDRKRAPAVLLRLRDPQSPVSVQEWQKHQAVEAIGPADDHLAKTVTVSANVSLKTYLQLRELLDGLQREMDHSTAVLDEFYGSRADLGLNRLTLATRRVYSNLQTAAFRDSLPYVPERTGFSADPNLLTLLVEPLYGKQPSVGVRELMQNAVDAVRELDAWCKHRGRAPESLELPDQEADVLIDFIRREDGSWFLRCTDKGIGMTADTLSSFFLRAGASFRQNPEWTKEFMDDSGNTRVLRAGRFGIGAFAAFLLGPELRLWTRHVTDAESVGHRLEATADSQLIEIRRERGLPVGTTVEVEITPESWDKLSVSKHAPPFQYITHTTDWFCWHWPSVVRRVVAGQEQRTLDQAFSAVLRDPQTGPEWALIQSDGLDAVYWTFANAPVLACNGFVIKDLQDRFAQMPYWSEHFAQLERPNVAVFDSAGNLPLTTQRYRLSENRLPFNLALARDMTLSFLAHALVCGPRSPGEAVSNCCRHPLCLSTSRDISEGVFGLDEGRLRWCASRIGFVPADQWLYTLLAAERCLVLGALDTVSADETPWIPAQAAAEGFLQAGCSMLSWLAYVDEEEMRRSRSADAAGEIMGEFLAELAREGIATIALLPRLPGVVHVLASVSRFVDIDALASTKATVFSEDSQDAESELNEKGTAQPEIHAARAPELFQWGNARASSINLKHALDVLQAALPQSQHRRYAPSILFVAELQTPSTEESPETLIAQVWNECLGPRAIPFDATDRKALIEHGRQHPDLRRHIEAWERMRCEGTVPE